MMQDFDMKSTLLEDTGPSLSWLKLSMTTDFVLMTAAEVDA